MATRLTIKDPNCLSVTLIPWRNRNIPSIDSITGVVNSAGVGGNTLNGDRAIYLQGVFAEDGAFATLESTQEEDEYIEAADGSICVFVKNRINEILTLRLNSCNGFIESLINLKNIRTGSDTLGNNRFGAVPIYVHVCDLCTGYSLVSDCAWILSNPTLTFGNDDSPVEVKILLSGARDNRLSTDRDQYNLIRQIEASGGSSPLGFGS